MKSKYSILAAACLLLSICGAYATISEDEAIENAVATSREAAAQALNAPEYTWFGLDFTYIKMFGDRGFQKADSRVQFGWNDLILKEKKKFNAQKAFGKKDVTYDFEAVGKRNKNVDLESSIVEKVPPQLTQEQISKEVAKLETGDMTGTGIVFIMELFDKTEKKGYGYMHVVFFDIQSKNVLLSTRMSGKASGFGKRNFWINTVYGTLKQMGGGVYKGLVKKYAK